MIAFNQTKDGNHIGVSILEIVSFPNKDISLGKDTSKEKLFLDMLREYRRSCIDSNTSLEIVWITEPSISKAHTSSIRIFIVVRIINSSKKVIEDKLDKVSKSYETLLRPSLYEIKSTSKSDFDRILSSITCEKIELIKKSEKTLLNPYTGSVLYHCDILGGEPFPLDRFISALSESQEIGVSFQLIPCQLNINEKIALNELKGIYGSMIRETSSNPDYNRDSTIQFLDFYHNIPENSLYYYNIVVFGKKATIDIVANRIMDIMYSISDDLASMETYTMPLSAEKFLRETFTYPWSFLNLLSGHINSQTSNDIAHLLIRKLSLSVTEKEAIQFFRLPEYDKKIPVFKESDSYISGNQYDCATSDVNSINIGNVATINGKLPFSCPKEDFTKHALIVGTPGSGKTTFCLNLLLQFYKNNIPFLAIEPTKTEYRTLIKIIPDLQIFTPGNNAVSPFIINPFIPPKGITIEQYIPALFSAFEAAFSMQSPLDIIFLKAIREAYNEYGWKDYNQLGDIGTIPFGMHEFVIVFKRIIRDSNYGKEVKGNLESAGTFRLLSLINQNKNIFDNINTIPIEDILNKPTLIELNSIQNLEQKSLIMAILLSVICLHTKINQRGDGKIKNAMLIDEAHVLLDSVSKSCSIGENNSQGSAIKSLQHMVAEIRSYGTSIIIADQSAKKVSREIVANTDIKIVFRLVEKEEKDIISNSINGNDNLIDYLPKLKVGEAFFFSSRLVSPELVKTPDIRNDHRLESVVLDKYIKNLLPYWNEHKKLLIPYKHCTLCKQCVEECHSLTRADAEFYSRQIFTKKRAAITDKMEIARHMKGIDILISNFIKNFDSDWKKRICICTAIQFHRLCQLELPFGLNTNEVEMILGYLEDKVYE